MPTATEEHKRARALALRAGVPHYVGAPCTKCGGTVRRTSSRRCLECARSYDRGASRRRYAETSDPNSPLARARKARAAAISAGESTYQGSTCPRCGGTEKRIHNCRCVSCHDTYEHIRSKRRHAERKASPSPRAVAISARKAALEEGRLTYEGQPCSSCGCTTRDAGHRHCMKCARVRYRTPEQKAKRKLWELANKDRIAEYNYRKKCRECGIEPPPLTHHLTQR